ncbi:MAG: type III-B CRISPR module RAMP protein Cmr4 [Hyphomicrobiales bacterium]|nr:type III-B CRISPR module RAMP protein Cmr4 [Hyphomicrobiales bacterium]
MSNKSMIISLMAETHIHAGVGQSTGALDLPVARERTTDYPFIPGSGVKGAMRVWAKERAAGLDIDDLFGKEGQAEKDEGGSGFAGNLLCSDARLLLLPVRCLSDAYKWVTCPAILKRFQRDCKRALEKPLHFSMQQANQQEYFGHGNTGGWIGLEEREVRCAGSVDPSILGGLQNVLGEDQSSDLEKRLVIISDTDFSWFARYALPVMARNVLKPDTKESENLWYEETLAPDTIMYLLLGERKEERVNSIAGAINPTNKARYIQMGGNETIGQGWFEMREVGGN